MRNPTSMGPGLYFPVHSWGLNRYCLSQLITRHYATRHLLCSSPLPLRPFNRSRLCHHGRLCTLIPPSYRLYPPQHLIKNPLWRNVCRRKLNLLPPTLPGSCRNTTTVLRLPRCLHTVKHRFLPRIPDFPNCCHYVPVHHLRSIRCQTCSILSRAHCNKH